MSTTSTLQTLLRQRILILDGAMGTMIQAYKLDEAAYRGERFADFAHDVKGNNDLLSLTQPQIIKEIHSQYLAAGADILETNSFNATSISMADYHMEFLVHELNVAAAKLAREAHRLLHFLHVAPACHLADKFYRHSNNSPLGHRAAVRAPKD